MPHSDFEYWLLDMGSTCGTYLNDQRVPPEGEGCLLSHGDVVSLGRSRVSTYLFYVAKRTVGGPSANKEA
jgi:pSer/pThr/pTyr-binding forkhead associated (FHA) protein